MITPTHLITCLSAMKPAQLGAMELLELLTALETDDDLKLDVGRVLALSPDIEAALQQAERVSNDSQRIVSQCLDLTPMPHPNVPLGF